MFFVWSQCYRELPTSLSPTDKVTTSSYFHLEVGSDSAPGGLQRKGQLERINWGEAGKVDCEGAVVLLSKVSPTYLGITGTT